MSLSVQKFWLNALNFEGAIGIKSQSQDKLQEEFPL